MGKLRIIFPIKEVKIPDQVARFTLQSHAGVWGKRGSGQALYIPQVLANYIGDMKGSIDIGVLSNGWIVIRKSPLKKEIK